MKLLILMRSSIFLILILIFSSNVMAGPEPLPDLIIVWGLISDDVLLDCEMINSVSIFDGDIDVTYGTGIIGLVGEYCGYRVDVLYQDMPDEFFIVIDGLSSEEMIFSGDDISNVDLSLVFPEHYYFEEVEEVEEEIQEPEEEIEEVEEEPQEVEENEEEVEIETQDDVQSEETAPTSSGSSTPSPPPSRPASSGSRPSSSLPQITTSPQEETQKPSETESDTSQIMTTIVETPVLQDIPLFQQTSSPKKESFDMTIIMLIAANILALVFVVLLLVVLFKKR